MTERGKQKQNKKTKGNFQLGLPVGSPSNKKLGSRALLSYISTWELYNAIGAFFISLEIPFSAYE